jgi:hypothetical protein
LGNTNLLVNALLNKTGWGRIKYILIMWPVVVIPAMTIALIVYSVFRGLGIDTGSLGPSFKEDVQRNTALFVCSAVVLVPFLETLLMGALIRFLQNFTKSLYGVAMLSAVVWAILHSLAAPLWGVVILWGFFVYSVAFIVWGNQKFMNGVWVATGIHGLNNLTAVALVILAS